MARWAVFAVLAALAVLPGHAQTTAPRPAFEVASVKLNTACDSGGAHGPVALSPGRIDLQCFTLRSLIGMAYGTFAGQNLSSRHLEVMGGPKWLDTDRFDISAKAEGGASAAQMAPMLQALLEDRFQLKVHAGSQDGPVYALTVIKNNPNLRPTKPGSCIPIDPTHLRPPIKAGGPKYCGVLGGGGRDGAKVTLDWYGMTMAEFAVRGLTMVDRPVVDKTGLTGQYDIRLEFLLDDPQGPASSNDAGPSVFTALESQLGLKLRPTKAPLDGIVVDQAEKPSAN